MITIDYKGCLGNNLFQLAVAKLLSEKFNIKIENVIENKIILNDTTKEEKKYNDSIVLNNTYIENILTNKDLLPPKNIILNDYYQTEIISKELFKNKNIIVSNNYECLNGLFVHFRLGDVAHCMESAFSYYDEQIFKVISEKNIINKYISTNLESKNHDHIKRLIDKYNLEFYENTAEETIIFASKFTNKIVSLGTFSWWIAFLGCQENIICPDLEKYKKWVGDILKIDGWTII